VDFLVRYVVFDGKQDLHKQLGKRLRGWLKTDTRFVVMRDQDSGDCRAIKAELLEICRANGCNDALIRIVCHELESWYLGDLAAVEQGLGLKGLVKFQNKSKFRTPDRIVDPVTELKRLTAGQYQKVAGSRAIGPHLNPEGNASTSFRALFQGLERLRTEMGFGVDHD
jgi:Domain of unknown function (DUF4276)